MSTPNLDALAAFVNTVLAGISIQARPSLPISLDRFRPDGASGEDRTPDMSTSRAMLLGVGTFVCLALCIAVFAALGVEMLFLVGPAIAIGFACRTRRWRVGALDVSSQLPRDGGPVTTDQQRTRKKAF